MKIKLATNLVLGKKSQFYFILRFQLKSATSEILFFPLHLAVGHLPKLSCIMNNSREMVLSIKCASKCEGETLFLQMLRELWK